MIFEETPLQDAYVVICEPIKDSRGSFARTWCAREFLAQGLVNSFSQCSISSNHLKGTLRGLHYQAFPHEETKLVRCISGSIFDVIVDLRPNSAHFKQWFSVILSSTNKKALYVPAGFAHGFQTLANESELFYQIEGEYVPEASRGIIWNDASLNISWPLPVTAISAADQNRPRLEP